MTTVLLRCRDGSPVANCRSARLTSGPARCLALAALLLGAATVGGLACAAEAGAAPPTPPVASAGELDWPRSGWRSTGEPKADFLQEVHYPASQVNTLGRDTSALIAGRIGGAIEGAVRKPGAARRAGAGDAPESSAGTRAADDVPTYSGSARGPARQPGRLVVDGIALPLLIEDDGRFARPWAFGPGSHGVEVRSADGAAVLRRQFYEANPLRSRARLRVVLSWDSDQTDLDLHVLSPDGAHVFYGQRVAANGGALDVDVTTGFGPEIFASPAPLQGAYHVYVNYYGAFEQREELTIAQVAVITDEGTPREKQQWRRVPMRRPGELTHVFSFLMP